MKACSLWDQNKSPNGTANMLRVGKIATTGGAPQRKPALPVALPPVLVSLLRLFFNRHAASLAHANGMAWDAYGNTWFGLLSELSTRIHNWPTIWTHSYL